jgi:predicted transcriptional regulator
MLTQGIPVGGLNTIGQIVGTNTLQFYAHQNGLAIAVALLSTHTAGSPVVDGQGRYVGFINEFDVMRVLAAGKDLGKLKAEDIMRKDQLAVTPSTRIAEAATRMEEHHVFNLPVVDQNGVVAYSVSRHDLLRAWIGLGVGMGLDP